MTLLHEAGPPVAAVGLVLTSFLRRVPILSHFCERVGGYGPQSKVFKCKMYKFEVPTLANNARVGQPQSL